MNEMQGFAKSTLTEKVRAIAQRILGVLFILASLGGMAAGDFMAALPHLVAGILITPETWDVLAKKVSYSSLVKYRWIIALVAAVIAIGGLVMSNIENTRKREAEGKQLAPTVNVAPVAPPQSLSSHAVPSQAKEDSDNRCFIYGKSVATVYLANVETMARENLMASTVMEEGCSRESANSFDKASCVHYCGLGFKSMVKGLLKNK